VVIAAVVGGGLALQRGLGPRTPPRASPGTARSGAWFCPHGGGPKEWKATLYLANPGVADVTARVTSLSVHHRSAPDSVTVPAQATVAVTVPAVGREASAFVEYFGGWIAAGWVTQGGAGEIGVGAEPCAPAAARTWYAPDGTTTQGEDAYLVVMNPFAADAVFDVVLLTPRRAPIRDSKLTDVVLKAGRSVAFRLNAFAEGEAAVGAEVDVNLGRVAVSSLGISRDGGIRSVIGATAASSKAYVGAGAGSGQSSLVLMVPGERQLRFGATLLSKDPAQPAGGLTEAQQNPTSARLFPVTTSGAASIDVVSQASVPFVASQHAVGVGNDSAATGGAQPAARWVVLPAIAGEPALPGLVLVDPGNQTVTVTLHALAAAGDTPPADVTLTISAGSVATAPPAFLDQLPFGAVEVRAVGGAVLATAASTSLGVKGRSTYALSVGVAEPGT
jgi:hypothetical protein